MPETTPTTPAAPQGPATYRDLFPAFHDLLTHAGSMADETSPLAYLTKLYNRAIRLEVGALPQARTLAVRRPDLADLMLDSLNLNRAESTLGLTVKILKRQARRAIGVDRNSELAERLANETAPLGLPFHAPWDRIHTTLDTSKTPLWTFLRKTDRDYPSFLARQGADSDLPRCLTLGSRMPPALQEALIAPLVDEATAVARFTAKPGMTVALLASVPTFMAATHLTRREVRHLLAVKGPVALGNERTAVRKSPNVTYGVAKATSKVWGASYINDGRAALWLKQAADAEQGNTTIMGLSAAHLDRIYCLLQVRRTFGLSIADTDLILSSIQRATVESVGEGQTVDLTSDPLLRALGLFGHLRDGVLIDAEQFAALLDRISVYTAGNGTSFYDRLFAGTQGTALVLDGSAFIDGGTLNTDAIALLARGLGVDVFMATSLLAMVRTVRGDSKVLRDLSTVSACYRAVTLSRLFGLSPHQGIKLIDLLGNQDQAFLKQLFGTPSIRSSTYIDAETGALIGTPPQDHMDILDVIVGFWNAAEWIEKNRIDIHKLYGALQDITPGAPSSEWLAGIGAHANEITDSRLTEGECTAKLGNPTGDGTVPATWMRLLSDAMSSSGCVKPSLAALDDKALRSTLAKAMNSIDIRYVAGEDKEKRKNELLGLIKAKAKRRLTLYESLSKAVLGLTDPILANAVVSWSGIGRDAFIADIDTLVVAYAAGKTPSGDALALDLRQRCRRIQRHADLATLFNLSGPAVDLFATHPDWVDLEPWTSTSRQGTAPERRSPDLGDAYRIWSYANLLARLPEKYAESDIIQYLNDVNGTTPLTELEASRRMAPLIDWQTEEVLALGRHLHPDTGSGRLTDLGDIDLALRMRDLARRTSVSYATMQQIAELGPASSLADVDAVATALIASGTDELKKKATDAHRDHWRNALCQCLLHHWAGKDSNLADIVDRPALSIYLLTDVDIGPEPVTTLVAHAIASLQQYIHRLYARLELYFANNDTFESDRQAWLTWHSQYPLWKLHTQMRRHPEDYLDPTQRTRKTKAFTDMEKLVAQSKFSNDDVQVALLAYLSSFEQVSNIQPISCYEDGTQPLRDVFHFVGRSNTLPTKYYWRTLDMSLRAPDKSPSMLAWSEWEEIGLPLNGIIKTTKLLTGSMGSRTRIDTIRPIIIAGRRYVVWLERDTSPLMNEDIGKKETGKSAYYIHSLCYAYLQTDGQWSSSNPLIVLDGSSTDGQPQDAAPKTNENTLKMLSYEPQLAVMTYCEGKERIEDPWFVAVLYDEAKLGNGATKNDIKSKLTQIRTDVKANTLVAARDLLLIQNKTIANIDTLLTNWYEIFRDPLTVQHVYMGVRSELNIKAEQAPRFSRTDKAQDESLNFATNNALYRPEIKATITERIATITCTLVAPDVASLAAPRYIEKLPLDHLVKQEIYSTDGHLYANLTFDCAGTVEIYVATAINLHRHGAQNDISSDIRTAEPKVLNTAEKIVAGPQPSPAPQITATLNLIDGITDYPIAIDILDGRTILARATTTLVWSGTSKSGTNVVDDKTPSVELRSNTKDVHSINFTEANQKSLQVADNIPNPDLMLNTLFGKDLVARATESIDRVLDWSTQQLTQPGTDTNATTRQLLDLNGANGLYFRELFFHMPWLVAWRLRESRQFRDAQAWCTKWLFDPYPDPNASKPYWKTRPLSENAPILPPETTLNDSLLATYTDGDCYRRAIFHFLVELWRMEGDDHYRRMTRDSLAQAWLCYEKAMALIGPLPEALGGESWTPTRLADASEVDLFLRTPDQAIISARDLIANRLFNLRHGLALDGKRATLPMYAEPPPLAMLGSPRTGMASVPSLAVSWQVPHYRYAEVLPRAREAAQRLTDMGRRLFEIYEKEFDAGLAVMFQADAIRLNEYAITLQRNQLDIARTTRDKLKAARRQVEMRFERYKNLHDNGLLHNERAKMAFSVLSQLWRTAEIPLTLHEATADMVPSIYGLAVGGQHNGAMFAAIKLGLHTTADIFSLISEGVGWEAEMARRDQEWVAERDAATYELDTIDEEIRAQTLQIDAEKIALQESLDRHELMKKEYLFMTNGFAIGPTYIWMISQLSYVYAATYDAVYALCEATNAACDFETDMLGTRYVWPNAWTDEWKGMLAGEQLERQLLQMDAEFMHRNERRMLIEHEISLAALLGKGNTSEGLKIITDALEKPAPSISFDLTHALFDDDYPGHYLRRIKHISITLAFADDRIPMSGAAAATLTQTRSMILVAPDLDGVNWEYLPPKEKSKQAVPPCLRINILPEQYAAVSTSTGNTDITTQLSVLGKILFDDDRRLAFEGTGAISSWTLKFTGRRDPLLEVLRGPDGPTTKTWRLEDIKVKMHYTAIPGPGDFTSAVTAIRDKNFKDAIPSQRWTIRTVPVPGSTSLGPHVQTPLAAAKASATGGTEASGQSMPAGSTSRDSSDIGSNPSAPPDNGNSGQRTPPSTGAEVDTSGGGSGGSAGSTPGADTGGGSSGAGSNPPDNPGSGDTGQGSTPSAATGDGTAGGGSGGSAGSTPGGGSDTTPTNTYPPSGPDDRPSDTKSPQDNVPPLNPPLPSGATPIPLPDPEPSDATRDARWPRVKQFVEAMLGLGVFTFKEGGGEQNAKGQNIITRNFQPYTAKGKEKMFWFLN
ncbi:hypothetical protein KCV01_g5884, partial [Aureobasidium melanogenum]